MLRDLLVTLKIVPRLRVNLKLLVSQPSAHSIPMAIIVAMPPTGVMMVQECL